MKKNALRLALTILTLLSIGIILFRSASAQECPLFTQGDANCDGAITVVDFEIFRKEYTGEVTTRMSDFDNDGIPSISDFEIWRQGYFSVQSTPSVTAVPPTSPVTSTIWYVSSTGTDNNNGSKNTPFKTITKAVSVAQEGEEIHIMSGTYSEKVSITGKKGSPGKPIVIVGESSDPAQYPVIDGGDSTSSTSTSWASVKPAFTLTGSSWIVLERLKIVNSSDASVFIDNSSYIVVRRTIMDYHRYGVLNRNNSHHILIERNEIYQSYGDQPWSAIKSSKWEGGAYTSFGGAGMITIRYNYIHDSFNGVYIYRNTRTGPYMDANVWIYRNRFEKILDDPYEPDVSYAFNNHFFNNTLINTHRMVSMASGSSALPDKNLGPIYIYNNIQLTTYDITKEAVARTSKNSAWKVELNINSFTNGIYMFNNSIDLLEPVNGLGAHLLNRTVYNWHHYNNAYRTKLAVFSDSPIFNSSESDNNVSLGGMGLQETHGKQNIDPGFVNSFQEKFMLKSDAAARGMSRQLSFNVGFKDSAVISAGADAGAYQYGETDFRKTPDPKYEVPPGGEPVGFGSTNYPWPEDTRGGYNPASGPR